MYFKLAASLALIDRKPGTDPMPLSLRPEIIGKPSKHPDTPWFLVDVGAGSGLTYGIGVRPHFRQSESLVGRHDRGPATIRIA